jgi:hypothetical protein
MANQNPLFSKYWLEGESENHQQDDPERWIREIRPYKGAHSA